METASTTHRMTANDLGRFELACREHNLKVTHQRSEVFRAVVEAHGHPTVEDIYDVVHQRIPSVSLDTVYRTLDTFSQIGLVKRFMSTDGRYRFETNHEIHQHLVCVKCGRIEDFQWDGMEKMQMPKIEGWSDIELANVEVHGLCSRCRR